VPVLIEGVGPDWIVIRKLGGRPELVVFKSLEDMRRQMTRALLKSETSVSLPVVTEPPPVPAVAPRPRRRTARTRRHPPAVAVPPELDCKTCGACCVSKSGSKRHASLEPEDVEAIPPSLRLVHQDADGSWTRTKVNAQEQTVCAALTGTVGGNCQCSIYGNRPTVCRIFEAGSTECLKARKVLGL
jgi:hypothetical protein